MGSISTNEWGSQPDTLGVDNYLPLFTQTKSGGRQGEKERRKRGRLLSSLHIHSAKILYVAGPSNEISRALDEISGQVVVFFQLYSYLLVAGCY